MITNLLGAISGFITHTISSLGYLGVALLMALQSAAIPIPSEVIMPFAGFLVSSGRFSLLPLAFIASIGSVIGASVTYTIGYYGGRALIHKYGRFVLISESDLALTEKFFARFGSWSAILGSLLPIVRTFISIPAGIAKVSLPKFLTLYFIGTFIWCFVLAWFGEKLGDNWPSSQTYFRKFDVVIVILVLIGLVFWVRRHLKRS